MTLQNAIKKLSKHGEVQNNGQNYWTQINNSIVEFMRNGRAEDNKSITCIRVRHIRDNDDSMTDYCAGVWCDSLAQALKLTN